MDCLTTMEPATTTRQKIKTTQKEVRCAVRFPLALAVVVSTDEGDFIANTQNVSASGVLFEMEHSIQTGTPVRFFSADARKCAGNEPRCSGSVQWACGTLHLDSDKIPHSSYN